MQNEVIDILTKVGAILPNDHFVGTSGRNFDTYINKDMLYPHTAETSRICELFAERHKDLPIEAVAAPALGGIILSQWTAHHLSKVKGREVLGIYAEKISDGLALTRGYDRFVKGKKVLVVEDLTTTGGSLQKVIEAVKGAGGNVLAACVMVNKSPSTVTAETIGVPFSALAELVVETYVAAECPMCKSGVPINTTIGHGKKFLEQMQNSRSDA